MSTEETKPLKKKIALLITKSNWGGAQKNVYDIATHLDPKKYDVVVLLGGHGLLKKKLSEIGIRTISIENLERNINFKKEILNFIEIYKILKAEKPDILHLHSPKAAGIGAFVARILGIKKIIYTVHGWAFNEDRSFIQKTLIFLFSWLTTILSTKIINISIKEKNQTEQFPFIKNKIVYIPNGVRENSVLRSGDARHSIEKIIGKELKDKFVIGMIGELHKNKGYTYTLEAMPIIVKDHPNTVLIIIGSGEQQEFLQKMIEKLGLQSHVYLVGFLENAPQYAKAFDVFLMSSVKEGLPYVIMEVGIVGVPIVSTTVGGIPDIIDDMKSGILIQPKKSQEINYAITFMHEHPDLSSEYSRNISKKIKTDFSLQKMIQSIEHEYFIEDPKIHS